MFDKFQQINAVLWPDNLKESRTVLDFLLMLCSVGQHYPGFETDIHGAKQDEDGVYRVRVLKMAG